MFQNADEAKKFISDEDVKFVDVRFCDLPGVMQHFTIPASVFDPDEELAFDGSSIRGFQAIHESDMALRADLSTARMDPFRRDKTLNINFFIHDPITGEQYSRDPRNIAKKAEAYLASTGIADTAYFGPRPSSTSSTASASRPARTSPSTTSTPRRAPGTPVRWRTTAATRSATRAATSRPRRSTTSPTCAPRSPWSWTRPACRSSASTTRSAPPARRRSTTSSTRCSPPPTT